MYERRLPFLSVVFDTVPDSILRGEWRLDKGCNKVAHDRMQQALTAITTWSVSDMPRWLRACIIPSAMAHLNPPQQSRSSDALSMIYYRWGDVCSTPDGSSIIKACLSSIPSINVHQEMGQAIRSMPGVLSSERVKSFREKLRRNIVSPRLNASQIQAICHGLEHRLSLVQGPPGTGKTLTAVHLIKAWRELHPDSGPILATAQSNIAVDQLLSGCLKLGLNAVRLGQPVRVTEDLQKCTLDALLRQHPKMDELECIQQDIQYLRSLRESVSGRDIGFLHRDISIRTKEYNTLSDDISKEVVSSADVICATCIGTGSDLLKGTAFNFIVLDEATQCTEPEGLVPLVKATKDASVLSHSTTAQYNRARVDIGGPHWRSSAIASNGAQ